MKHVSPQTCTPSLPPDPRRGRDSVHPFKVTLRELYEGKTKQLRVSHKVLCKDCKGKGTAGEATGNFVCSDCDGSGVVMKTQSRGFMITSVQSGT